MGDLASIGYNGQPAAQSVSGGASADHCADRSDGALSARAAPVGRYHANGLQLHKVVEGRLTCWGICEQGDWWGLVTYPIAYGSKRKTVTHWVPAWTLRRNDAGSERAR